MNTGFQLNIRKINSSFDDYKHLVDFISLPEIERANNFKENADASAFIQGRFIVRSELSKLLDCEPRNVPIKLSEHGKPFCPIDNLPKFSITHCKNLVIVGWSKNEIGVDVEPADTQLNEAEIQAVLLHPNEKKLYDAKTQGKKSINFLKLFVLKEAYLKLQGSGLFIDLNQVEIQQISSRIFTGAHGKDKKNIINLYCLSNSWIIAVAV